MRLLIAVAGLAGMFALAYSLFGAEFMFPRWKRVALGLAGLVMVVTFWVVRPVWHLKDDGPGCEPTGRIDWDCP